MAVSFRRRLTLFFILIVALPMVVIGVLSTRTAGDAASGKADARLFAGLETATALYEDRILAAKTVAEEIASNPGLAAAIRAGDADQAGAIVDELAALHGVKGLVLRSSGGEVLASVGGRELFAPATLELDDEGSPAGTLVVSMIRENAFTNQVERLTGREAALYVQGQPAVTVAEDESVAVPAGGGANVTVDGRERRVLTGDLPDDEGRRLALFGPAEEEGLLASSPLVATILIGFFGIALLAVLGVRRTLAGQVRTMLEAAKRIGAGDFSQRIPVTGSERDEMAGLAAEFNKMSDRLAAQMDELRRQQVEIDRSVRRLGEAFASGLDRDGLLEIVAETAVSACEADAGVIALSGVEGAEVTAGTPTEALADAMLTAESKATRADGPIEHSEDGACTLAAPLHRIADPDHDLGVMTIARAGRPFAEGERDVFHYLIGQASASIENVALHKMVSEQAVTDELTDLANNRAFRDVAHKEAARAQRFSHPLSLVMLDIDDFKQVNDTYGHLQGDEVLRRIGAILRAESRGIDEPARYGGEEFAVALPETGPEGAVEVAERIRTRIEAEEVPFLGREGVLRISASLGVASIPDSAGDVQGLIAAADSALYAAKRGGKNRVELAPKRAAAAAGG